MTDRTAPAPAAVPAEVRMELLENGLDELASAVEHLAVTPTPRALKRAVTDLSGGVELVLKERLRRHDWRQLFDDVAIANEGDLRRGDFVSPTTSEVLRRLRDTVGVTLPNRHRKRLDALRRRRNRIEHFALIDTEEAIRASTAGCLSVVIDFVADEIDAATLSPIERELYEQVREALPRRQDVATTLAHARATATVVTCPSCDEDALVLDGAATCLFCRYRADAIEAADDFIGEVLGLVEYVEVTQGGEWPRHTCPECDADALVDTGGDGDERHICFSCGTTWRDGAIESCARCGEPLEVDGELSVCNGCLASLADRE
jgi:rubrerythrin